MALNLRSGSQSGVAVFLGALCCTCGSEPPQSELVLVVVSEAPEVSLVDVAEGVIWGAIRPVPVVKDAFAVSGDTAIAFLSGFPRSLGNQRCGCEYGESCCDANGSEHAA